MKLKSISSLLLLVTILQSNTNYACYSADMTKLTIEPTFKSPQVILAVRNDVENFEQMNVLLLDHQAERIEALAYIFCGKVKHGYECSAECDGGNINLTDELSITKVSMDFEKFHTKNSKDSDEPDTVYIDNKRSKSPISVKKIQCPKIVKALSNTQRDNSDIEQKLYVCYNEKEKLKNGYKYYGCKLDDQLCLYSNKAYFGHYATPSDAKAALKRCKRSTPRK
jgi:hypothetical protein